MERAAGVHRTARGEAHSGSANGQRWESAGFSRRITARRLRAHGPGLEGFRTGGSVALVDALAPSDCAVRKGPMLKCCNCAASATVLPRRGPLLCAQCAAHVLDLMGWGKVDPWRNEQKKPPTRLRPLRLPS